MLRKLETYHCPEALPLVQQLFLMLLLDLGQFFSNHSMIVMYTIELDHGSLRFLHTTMSEVISRAFGKEDDSNSEYQDPQKRDTLFIVSS